MGLTGQAESHRPGRLRRLHGLGAGVGVEEQPPRSPPRLAALPMLSVAVRVDLQRPVSLGARHEAQH